MLSSTSQSPFALQSTSATPEEYLRAEEAEIACWSAALRAPSVRVRSSLGLRVHENAWGAALVCAGADHAMLNRVYLRPSVDKGRLPDLDQLLRVHAQEGVVRYFVHVRDDAEPLFLRQLEDAGLVRYPRSWVKLRAPLETCEPAHKGQADVSPQGVAVRQVASREAARFAELFRIGFELPEALDPVYQALVGTEGFEVLGAFIDGRLSAAGVSYYHGRTAYLAGGVTAPQARRRGLQQALISARRREAIARHCHEWCTETGEEKQGEPQHSERNLQRHGLRRIGRRHNFAPPACKW